VSHKGEAAMPDIILRSLYPEDINRVIEIENSLTGASRRVFLEKRLAAATAMPDSFITSAALDGKKLAGYGIARILEGEFGASSVIVVLDTVGVDREYQGRGIGTMIMSGIERRMKRKEISTLYTQIIWSDHSIIKFFASAGFTLATGQIIERNTSPLAAAESEESISGPQIRVRPLKGEDIRIIDRIDARLTGLDRSAYFSSKFMEMLDESGTRVSMVAEIDGTVCGFIMARVDFGEFGKVTKSAVIDTIGVSPDHSGAGVGHALLSQLLQDLSALQVESVRTKVEYENSGLRNFLSKRGFCPSQRLLLVKHLH
jgi:ribosomal protein S18 acetylase RimI-like enzyme